MKLTTSTDLRRFENGGQIEIQNRSERYLFRGEVKTLRIEGEGDEATLTVELNWMAKGEGYPPGPDRWVKDDAKPYIIGLMIYGVSDIGSGRLSLNSPYTGEIVVLYPKGGSAIKKSEVVGL